MKRLNVKLALWLVGITVFSVVGVFFLHRYQESRNASFLKVQAEQAQSAGNDLEAIKYYNQYIRHRDDRDGYKALAELTVKVARDGNATKQDHARAYNTLEETIRRFPDMNEARADLVAYMVAMGRWNDALEHIQHLQEQGVKVITPTRISSSQAVDKAPEPMSLKVYEAICSLGKGEEDKARAKLCEIIGYDQETKQFAATAPELAKELDAYVMLTQILRRKNIEDPDADAIMLKMVEWNPDSVKAHLARATDLLTVWQRVRGDTPEGKDRKDQLIAGTKEESAAASKIEPDNADAMMLAASVLLLDQDFVKAQELLDRAVEKHPKRADVYLRRAGLAIGNKDFDKAAAELKAGVKAVDNPAALLEQLAEIQYQKHDLEGFRATCDQMRKIPVFRPEYMRYQDARLKLAEGKFLEAARELEQVRPAMERLNAGYQSTVNMQLGRAYEVLGMPDRQLEVYRRALDAIPTSLEARIGETMALQALGRFDEAASSVKLLTENAHVNAQLQPAILQVALNQELSKPAAERTWEATDKLAAMVEESGQRTPLQAQLLKAELLLVQQKSAEALAILGTLRKENPKDLTVWLSLAKLFAGDEKYRDRLPQLLTLATKELGDVWPLQAERIKLVARTGGETAAADLQKLEPGIKNYEPAAQQQLMALLGSAYLQAGDTKDALRCLKSVMESEKANARIRQLVFEIATETKDKETAVAVLKELKESPHFGPESATYRYCAAVHQLGEFGASRQGKTTPLTDDDHKALADVRKLVDEAIATRGEWAPLWRLRGQIDQFEGNLNGAIASYQRSLNYGQTNQDGTARSLIQLLYLAQRYTEANEAMRYLEGGEMTDEMRKLMELTKAKSGDAKKAIEMAKSDIEKDPENPSNYTWYGELLESDGDSAGAEAAYRQATVKGPKLATAWELLVRRLVNNKKPEEAAAAVKQAEATLSDTPLAMGRLYQRIGDTATAEKLYQSALTAKPGDLLAMRHLAELYLSQNKVAEATAQLDKVIENGKTSQDPAANNFVVWARNQKAQSLVAPGRDYESSLKAIELIKQNAQNGKLGPQETGSIINILGARINEPDSRDQAIALLEGLQKTLTNAGQKGLNPAQSVLLARLYDRAGKWEAARPMMLAAITTSGDNPDACIFFAEMLISHDAADEAKGYVTRAEELLQSSFAQPSSPQAQMVRSLRARLLVKEGNKEEAARVLESWLPRPLPQANLSWLLDVARQMEVLELYEPAERLYNEYASLSPKDGRLAIAAFYGRRGDFDQSFAILDRAIEGATMSEVLGVALANVRNFPQKATPDHFRKIEAWAKSAQELTTEPERLHLLMAEKYDLEGRYDEVIKIYREMLASGKLNPQLKAIVQNNLAFVLAAINPTPERGAEAQKLIEEAIRVLGPTSDILDTRAIAYLAQGKPDLAAADLKTALVDRPTTAKYYHLAQVEKQLGNVDAARAAITKAQELHGEHNPFTPAERKAYEQFKPEVN
jgi:type IV pilus assembly protein PilF